MVSGFLLYRSDLKVRPVAEQFGCALGLVVVLIATVLIGSSSAQVTTAIVPDSTLPTNTTVTQVDNIHNITNGTIRGNNQFHSFDQFNIGDGNIASFNGPVGIQNILSRVTGGTLSSIDGTLRSTIDGANLFFMNPAGVVFGPNASLDVSGSFHVSTADFVRLGEGENTGIFSATDPATDVLTSAPPAAFGFLDGNSGMIQINQSELTVGNNKSLLVVGGDISIMGDGGNDFIPEVSAPSGTVGLVSVASVGDVSVVSEDVTLDTFVTFGDISVSEGALVSSSGNPGGTIVVRAQNLDIRQGSLFSHTTGAANGLARGIDIQVADTLEMSNQAFLATDHFGIGTSGDIFVVANSVFVENSTISSRPFSGSTASSGDIFIRAFEDISITNDSLISSAAQGDFNTVSIGHAGDIGIFANQDILIDGSDVSSSVTGLGDSGDLFIQAGGDINLDVANLDTASSGGFVGQSGDVNVIAGRDLFVELSGINTMTDSFLGAPAGDVTVSASEVLVIEGSDIVTRSIAVAGRGGDVDLSADILTLDLSDINTASTSERSGNVTVNAGDYQQVNRSDIETSMALKGQAGSINITASRSATFDSAGGIPSTLFAGVMKVDVLPDPEGRGGDVIVQAPDIQFGNIAVGTSTVAGDPGGLIQFQGENITLNPGVIISNETIGSADAGETIISATQTFNFEGLGNIGSRSSGSGKSGPISVSSPVVSLNNGASIGIDLQGSGDGSPVTIQADQLNILNGSIIRSLALGTGNGGDIDIAVQEAILLEGVNSLLDPPYSQISNFTRGLGNAGSIEIVSPVIRLDAGVIVSSTVEIPGQIGGEGKSGNIFIDTAQLELINDARISASSATQESSTGAAGSVKINASEEIRLDFSAINSIGGTESDAGLIALATPILHLSNLSNISTLTENGAGGSVEIQANEVRVLSGSRIDSSTTGTASAGTVSISASDHVVIAGRNEDGTVQSAVNSASNEVATGSSGAVNVTAGVLQITDGFISTNASVDGDAGNIRIQTQDLLLTDGSINSKVEGVGTEGEITLHASQDIIVAGGEVSAETSGTGTGGKIVLAAGSDVQLTQSRVSSESTGSADAGNITLFAPDDIVLQDSTVTTEASQASGGNIKLDAGRLIQIVDSRIESAVQGDSSTQGGNISIDPDAVVIQNSQILANATNAGTGGNIEIVGNVVLVDPQSVIDASSSLGVSGTVNIQAPIQNLSGTIAPLPDVIIEATTLYGARCAAQKGSNFSSLNVRGRDRIPPEPGDYLWTPLWSRRTLDSTSERPGITSSPMAKRLGLSSVSSTSGSALAFLEYDHHVWEPFDIGCRS